MGGAKDNDPLGAEGIPPHAQPFQTSSKFEQMFYFQPVVGLILGLGSSKVIRVAVVCVASLCFCVSATELSFFSCVRVNKEADEGVCL